jgi:hypothetical protein
MHFCNILVILVLRISDFILVYFGV